jgi:hypothetical protein
MKRRVRILPEVTNVNVTPDSTAMELAAQILTSVQEDFIIVIKTQTALKSVPLLDVNVLLDLMEMENFAKTLTNVYQTRVILMLNV